MPTPTVAQLLETAIVKLTKLPAAELYAVAVKKRVPLYPDDDINRAELVKAHYADARALGRALLARDPLVLRSALFLLTSADAASAWPVLRPFVAKKAPAKAKGFGVVLKMAPYLVGTIPNIPDEELLPLFANPRVEIHALVAGVVFHRKAPEERLGVLTRALAEKKNEGTERLAAALVEELARRSRGALAEVLRGAGHTSWKAWAKAALVAIGEPAALEEAASDLDGPEPERAIAATIALGPARWGDLASRFFTTKALRAKGGRDRAASILHEITTAVLHRRARAWSKSEPFVAYVDTLADAQGPLLPRTAASLARVLRGKTPLF